MTKLRNPKWNKLTLHEKRQHRHRKYSSLKFAFFVNGYEKDWYFYEIVIMFRKVFMVVIAVYFNYNVHVQALMAVLLVVGYMNLHAFAKPFADWRMDLMEFFSLVTSFATFFCGQFLFIEDIADIGKQFVSFVIISANVMFLGCFVGLFIKVWREDTRGEEAIKYEKEIKRRMSMMNSPEDIEMDNIMKGVLNDFGIGIGEDEKKDLGPEAIKGSAARTMPARSTGTMRRTGHVRGLTDMTKDELQSVTRQLARQTLAERRRVSSKEDKIAGLTLTPIKEGKQLSVLNEEEPDLITIEEAPESLGIEIDAQDIPRAV